MPIASGTSLVPWSAWSIVGAAYAARPLEATASLIAILFAALARLFRHPNAWFTNPINRMRPIITGDDIGVPRLPTSAQA